MTSILPIAFQIRLKQFIRPNVMKTNQINIFPLFNYKLCYFLFERDTLFQKSFNKTYNCRQRVSGMQFIFSIHYCSQKNVCDIAICQTDFA